MADVFLSYRNTPQRRILVKRLAALLRAHELSVWWDYGLEAGESFRVQITSELAKARVVCPLWCHESIESKWVKLEAEMGKDRLIPARLQSVAPPPDFSEIQAADLARWDGSIDDPRVVAFIRTVCSRVGKSTDAPVDMLETLRELSRVPPLDDVPAAERVAPQKASQDAVLGDLRTTWTNFQSSSDFDGVARFLEHVSRSAPGTGLEFEVQQYLDRVRSQAVPKSEATFDGASAVQSHDSKHKIDANNRLGVATTHELRVVSIGSGKGGVGKSWLATSLAVHFSRRSLRTLLIDGNLGQANIDVLLKLTPEVDLASVIAGSIEIEDAICQYHSAGKTPCSFDVLPGRSGSGALAGMPPIEVSALAATVTALSLQYDVVIVDLGPGSDDVCMRLARASDACVVVATDEPTSMTDAYSFLKTLTAFAPSVLALIAINMAETRTAGRRTYEALAGAVHTYLKFRPPLVGIVSRDAAVREAIRSQITVFDLVRETQAGADAKEIAERLISELKLGKPRQSKS